MKELDLAGLVVIADRVRGTGAALGEIDIAAAQSALAEARRPAQEQAGTSTFPDRAQAAAAGIALVDALLRHRPFPSHGEQIAVAAGLQLLAINGWRADLDPPGAAAVVVEGLASGRLSAPGATAWLSARLSPRPARTTEVPMRTLLPRLRHLLAGADPRPRHVIMHTRPPEFTISIGPRYRAGMSTPATGHVPFTCHAYDSIHLAKQEAERFGHDHRWTPEDMLLGLTGEGSGTAARALASLGIGPEAVRQQVEQVTSQHQQARDLAAGHRALLMKVMPDALGEAVAHGQHHIGTSHLLLALFRDDDRPAVQALSRLGAGEGQLRDAITALPAE